MMASGGVDRTPAVPARGHAQDRQVARGGHAPGNSQAAISDPETLVREIERTRGELARTVDAITERVSPSNAARRAAVQIRLQAARVNPPLAAAAAAALVLGTTAFFVWRRRRR